MKFAKSDLRLNNATRSMDELLTEATDRLASDSIDIGEGRGSPPAPLRTATLTQGNLLHPNLPKGNLLQSMASQI